MKKYNVGILGFGFIGKVHAYGYRNLSLYYDPVPLEAEITHVCTSRPETAEKGRKLIGAEHAVVDYREVTENPEIDIVHICTPNHLHKDAVLSAMAHGKHIYCDKPITATLEEAEEIGRAMATYRGVAQMTFHLRFFPAVMRAKQLIEEGFLGGVLEFRAAFLHAGSASPKAPLKWKLTKAAGGGVIADLGSHVFDMIHYLLGGYQSISSMTKIAYPKRPSLEDPSLMLEVDAEDSVLMLAKMHSGAVGTIEATKLASGAEDELRFEIHGSCGAIRFNSMDPHHLEAYDATLDDKPIGGVKGWTTIDCGQRYPLPATGFPAVKSTLGWIRAHLACLHNFLQAVAENRPSGVGLEQGIYIQRLMDVARRSADEGRWIEVE